MSESPVIVVDDEPDVLDLLHEVLRDEGLPVIAVDRPDRAINAATSVTPSVVLLDLMMPGCNGIELARKLRRQGLQRTPMVAISASERMLSAAKASELFDGTLAKPFDLTDLLDCVDRLTSDRRSA